MDGERADYDEACAGGHVRLAAPLPGFHLKPTVLRPHPPSSGRLSMGSENIALRLGLPGRSGLAGTASPSRVASDGGEKTPRAVPSADVLRLALAELPNNPGGPLDDRAKWVGMAHAIKGATSAGSFDAEVRADFIQWSTQ